MKMKKKTDDTNPKDRLGIRKLPLSLIPGVALVYTALVFELGARKYGEFNWRNRKVRLRIYLEAQDRHRLALAAGQDLDPESGLPHEAHIIAGNMILLDARASGCLIDDRFEGDGAAALLDKFTAKDYAAAARKAPRTPARTLDQVRSEAARAKARAKSRAKRRT